VSLNLAGCPSEPFFSVIFTFDSTLDLITFPFEFVESTREFIAFIEEFSELAEKDGVSQKKSAVFVIILEVGVLVQ